MTIGLQQIAAENAVARLASSDRGRKALSHLQGFLDDCGIGLDPQNWLAVEKILSAAQVTPGTVLELLSPYNPRKDRS